MHKVRRSCPWVFMYKDGSLELFINLVSSKYPLILINSAIPSAWCLFETIEGLFLTCNFNCAAIASTVLIASMRTMRANVSS